MSDPIADLIIRIKNGYMAGKDIIESPYSQYREQVLKKLKVLHYIKSYEVLGDTIKHVRIMLLYDNRAPAVTDVKIFSKPGRRWYTHVNQLKPVLGGMGYSIISTPKGILTHVEAKKNRLGGELLFNVW